MSEYWDGLLKYNKKLTVLEVREQTQEDILAYVEDKLADDCYKDKFKDDLCQIVVNNFKKLEK